MDQPTFNVHDISVSHQVTPDGKGGFTTTKHVSYYVGTHGPFFKDYDAATSTAAQIKSDIGAQVAELQDLNTLTT